jgi:aminocarboxycyclopropane-forming enzyme
VADDRLFIGYDHVAYATRDTDATVKLLSLMGMELRVYKQPLDRFGCLITKMVSGDDVAEIVEPQPGEASVVSRLLGDKDATVYHTCFRTNDIRAAAQALKALGALTITHPMRIPYPVTEAHKEFLTSHMYHPHLGLFEITGPVRECNEDSAP